MATAKKAKKTSTKKHKVTTPGEETRAVFSSALTLAKELLSLKGLRIGIDEDGDVDFTIYGQKVDTIPKDKFKHGLKKGQFLAITRTEIESLLQASTYADPTRGIQREIPSEIIKKVGIDEFLWRLHQVEKELAPPDLKERIIFRQTARGFIMKNVNWQVIMKKHDQARGKLSDIPYGCLSISYVSPQTNLSPIIRFRSEAGSMELPTVREPHQLILELHKADVEELIETLTDLRDNLQKIKNGK